MVLDGRKASILGTVIDDQLCFRLADPGKRHQFRKIRLINIDKTGYFVIGAGASLGGRFLSFAGNCDLFPVCQKTRLINCGSIALRLRPPAASTASQTRASPCKR